jgi:hypothetical protein
MTPASKTRGSEQVVQSSGEVATIGLSQERVDGKEAERRRPLLLATSLPFHAGRNGVVAARLALHARAEVGAVAVLLADG